MTDFGAMAVQVRENATVLRQEAAQTRQVESYIPRGGKVQGVRNPQDRASEYERLAGILDEVAAALERATTEAGPAV